LVEPVSSQSRFISKSSLPHIIPDNVHGCAVLLLNVFNQHLCEPARFLPGPYTLQGVEWTPSTTIENKTVIASLGKALVAQDEINDNFDSGIHHALPVAMGG